MSTTFIDLPLNNKGPTTANRTTSVQVTDDEIEQVFYTTFKGFAEFEKRSQLASPIFTMATQNSNGFLSTVHEAFANERPLVLSPDHIWAAIMQAVSIHVNQNAEKLRDVFVDHKGKKTITVRHDGLHKGVQDSPWEEVFPVFAQALGENVKDASFVKHATSRFTTSTQTEQIVHTIALMDAMQQYFSYSVMTMCGIPRIELLGTVEDWLALLERAEAICKQAQMQWWADELIPVLFHFVVLAKAPANAPVAFWSRIYNRSGANGSGSVPSANGWINVFFPYSVGDSGYSKRRTEPVPDQKLFFNNLADEAWWKQHLRRSWGGNSKSFLCSSDIGYKNYPSGVSLAPFRWIYFDEQLPMTLCGGFLTCVGSAQGGSGAVMPLLAWTVAHGTAKPIKNTGDFDDDDDFE